jgi:hypothetical protein
VRPAWTPHERARIRRARIIGDTVAALWFGLLAAMGVWSLATREPPSPGWLLPFAILAIAAGSRQIYYREEASEILARRTARWLRWGLRWQAPWVLALSGVGILAWGVVVLGLFAAGIVRRLR